MRKQYQFKLTLLIAIIAFAMPACDESRLDVEPVNEFLSANFFISEEQVFSGLVAAYDPLGWTMAFGQWISPVMYNEIRSDNANAGGDPSNNDQPGWQEIDDFLNTNTNVVTYPIYRRNYIGIFRANLVITRSQIESPQVDIYRAEAQVLRAYYHFELFKHFGPVPVITEPLAPDQVDLPRNTLSELFTAITTDLEEAIQVLPATVSSADAGRITRGAALSILGEAYIAWADFDNDDQAKFDLAADALQDVIDLGIYDLEDDMQNLYGFNVKNPVESVFELQQSNLFPSDWGWFEGIDGNGMVQLCGIRGLCTDHPFLQAGWGFMLPTQSLYDHYLDDDTYRRDATLTSEDELVNDLAEAGVNTCTVAVDETQGNPIDQTGYWQDKYKNYKNYEGNNVNGGDPNLTKDANIYEYRLAEVYLLAAEALTRGSGSEATAMDLINLVRERAAGPGDNTGNFRTAQQVMSDEGWSLLDLIWYERRAELAMEGDRWFELVRSGRATPELFAGDPIREGNFNDNDLWLPIPLQELAVATGLTEYPGPELFQ